MSPTDDRPLPGQLGIALAGVRDVPPRRRGRRKPTPDTREIAGAFLGTLLQRAADCVRAAEQLGAAEPSAAAMRLIARAREFVGTVEIFATQFAADARAARRDVEPR